VAAPERRRPEGDAGEARCTDPAHAAEILIAFIKKWDETARREGEKNPFFKKVHDSQRAYASLVVPYKRSYFPPYSFMANYYFPRRSSGACRHMEVAPD
jgi:hypothetical protein